MVEGAKAFSAPRGTIENPARQPLAVAMSSLEGEIANLMKSRGIWLLGRRRSSPTNSQELARSAAVHSGYESRAFAPQQPEGFDTFYLLHEKFARDDQEYHHESSMEHVRKQPDWKRLHIRHGWGGASVPECILMLAAA